MSLIKRAWRNRAPKIPDGTDRGLNTKPHQDISTIVEVSVDQLHAIVHHNGRSKSPIEEKKQEIIAFFEQAINDIGQAPELSQLLSTIKGYCNQVTRTGMITIPRAHLQSLNTPDNRLIAALQTTSMIDTACRLSRWAKHVAPPRQKAPQPQVTR